MIKVVTRIRRWLPDTFILENVSGLTHRKNAKFFKKLLARLLSCNSMRDQSLNLLTSDDGKYVSRALSPLRLKAGGHYEVQWKARYSTA